MEDSGKRLADGKLTSERKRKKWEAKQSKIQEEVKKERWRMQWVQDHKNFSFLVSEADVETAKLEENMKNDNSLGRALAPYFDVQKKTSKDSVSNPSNERLFIAEGTETVRILIQQSTRQGSPIQLRSVFLKPCLLFDDPVRLLADVHHAIERRKRGTGSDGVHHPGFRILIGSESVLSRVAGFHIARGSLACGVVPGDRDEAWLTTFLRGKRGGRIRILALDGICDNSNLGSMIRCASAFGIGVIVLSHDTCDCWYRRTIRVSMGHIFKVPIVRVKNLALELERWSDEYNVISYAAVLDTDKLLTDIKPCKVPPSWCCVMGNEGNGISTAVRNAVTQHVRIHIESGVDSLSVPVATGILLNGLRERENPFEV